MPSKFSLSKNGVNIISFQLFFLLDFPNPEGLHVANIMYGIFDFVFKCFSTFEIQTEFCLFFWLFA